MNERIAKSVSRIVYILMNDREKVEEGEFNFCEEVWFHCKKINYKRGESCEMTYEILEG